MISLVSRHVEVCLGRISTRRIRIWGQKLPIWSTRAEQIRKTTVRDLSVWTCFCLVLVVLVVVLVVLAVVLGLVEVVASHYCYRY